MEEDWIGKRIRAYRSAANMSQTYLADQAGISQGYLSQLENGHKTVNTRALLADLAGALGVAVTDLTATPAHARSSGERKLHAAVPGIRAALDGASEVPPVPMAHLRAQVHALMTARMACDHQHLADMLAPTLARTLAAAEAGGDGYILFAKTCFTASMALRPLGAYLDLAIRLAERTQWAAAYAQDPAAIGAAEFARSQCCLAGGVGGLRRRALHLATAGAQELAGQTDPQTRGWQGLLHLQAGLTAASLQRPDLADQHITEALAIAARTTGDTWHMDFSEDNALVWKAATLLETQQPAEAVRVARSVNRARLRTEQRKAHLLMHLGRGLFAQGDTDEATAAFLYARRIAPSEVDGRPAVRETVGAMLRAKRRAAGSERLRELANHVGVDPLADVN